MKGPQVLKTQTIDVGRPRLSENEVAKMRSRRPGIRASLACEGLVLDAEEETLLDEMEDEALTQEDRDRRVMDFIRERHAREG